MKNPNWPAYVCESNGRIVYRPRWKTEPPEGYGIDSRGFLKPPIKLGKRGDPDELILQRYLAARSTLHHAPRLTRKNTLFWVMDAYLLSPKFKGLSPTSQQWYTVHLKVFLNVKLASKAHGEMLLGDLQVSALTLPGINRIKAKLLADSSSPSYVNGHIRACRAMLTWALNNIDGIGVQANPFLGISLDQENQRTRYVTDDDYMAQYLFAVDHAPEYLPLVFEHAYLLAGRSIEVANLTLADILAEGYLVRRTKHSKDNVVAYTPRLEAARDAALAYRNKVRAKGPWLIPSTTGTKLTKDTLQSAMADLKKRMQKAGLSAICWNLHDLKRKGISDAKDARIGGHKSDHIRQRYMVKLETYVAPA